MSIGFLGLGNMGGPMAGHLVRAGERVVGYDPAEPARARAEAAGVIMADNPAAAVAEADVVITMLISGSQVLDVYRELVPAARPGTLFLDCSTIDVADARAAAELATAAGHTAVDAPVSGGVAGAEAATLTFMVGGEPAGFAAAEPYLQRMGGRIIHCGAAGAGQAVKMCNNLILGVSMIAVSEGFALGQKLGLDDQVLFDVVSMASGQCWSVTTNCPVPGPVPTSPANRGYQGGFASALMLKDLRLAQAAAEANGVRTELARHAAELYAAFVEQDGPGRDFSAIITSLRDVGTSR